jgi:hypothetical protein
MALAYIGQGRIASIEEESEEAIQCRIFYDHLRRKLLSEHRWGFAERYVKLALLNEEIPGWKYIYAYPAKCLVIRKIYEKESAREIGKEDYFISTVNDSTKVICTDIQNAYASYTADVENGELFTDYFIEALSHSLAANIAVPLSGSPSAANLQYQLMHQALINAKQESAVQNHHETTYPHKYFNMRG